MSVIGVTRRTARRSSDGVRAEVREEGQDGETEGLVQKTADELFQRIL